MATKKEYEDLLEIYKGNLKLLQDQIQELREDKSKLQNQLFNLQNGLMAVRSPEAYRDMRADQGESTPAMDPEVAEKNRIYKEVQTRHLENIEGDLFTDADDMINMLSGPLNSGAMESKSIHGNDES